MPRFQIILTTVSRRSRALNLARSLIDKKLAACVNILGPGDSVYRWKGKIERAKEFLLVIKARASSFLRIQKFISSRHPYEVPEIVALPIEKGNASYLNWILKNT